MMFSARICLALAAAALAQDPAEEPEATKRLVSAAADAIEAGDTIKAEAILVSIVREAEKGGHEDLLLAKALSRLGGFYTDKKRKRYAEAEPLLERAVAIHKKIEGADHPEYADALVDLAACKIASEDKTEDGKRLLERALSIFEKAGGKNDADVARTLRLLAHWHLTHKDPKQAESLLMRALANREKALGPESEALAETLNDLGLVHLARSQENDFEEALAEAKGGSKQESKSECHGKQAEFFYKRALANREKHLKPDDALIAESVFNLAQLEAFRGHAAEMQSYAERWLALQNTKAAPSEKHAMVLMMVGGALMQRKQFDQAERRFAEVQDIIGKLKGEDSEDVGAIVAMRADLAFQAGRFPDCERRLKQALEIEESLLGRDDPDVIEAVTLLKGHYTDHVADRRGYELWNKLNALEYRAKYEHKHDTLGSIVSSYGDLLRRTNNVVPRPTEADFAYLKKINAVTPFDDLDSLLETESISDDELDEKGLAHIARLYGLKWLTLRNAEIGDKGLNQLKDLTNLRRLFISRTGITDHGLAAIAHLENLESLNLFGNRVTDAGLAHLSGLKNLRELDLAYTNVSDAGLKNLDGLKKLEKLSLENTKVTQAGVDALQRKRPRLKIEYEPRTFDPFTLTKPVLAAPPPGAPPTRPAELTDPKPIP